MQNPHLPDATKQFLHSILTLWNQLGGSISGDMNQHTYLGPPLNKIPQFTANNGYLYPHIHIISQGITCRFVASCNDQGAGSHGTGSDISPTVINPTTGHNSTAQEFIVFFMHRLKECQTINARSGIGAAPAAAAPGFGRFSAFGRTASPASAPVALGGVAAFPNRMVPRSVIKNAKAQGAQGISKQGGRQRIIKKTQRRRRGRRGNGSRTRRIKSN